jgi:hypothetical protein
LNLIKLLRTSIDQAQSIGGSLNKFITGDNYQKGESVKEVLDSVNAIIDNVKNVNKVNSKRKHRKVK